MVFSLLRVFARGVVFCYWGKFEQLFRYKKKSLGYFPEYVYFVFSKKERLK